MNKKLTALLILCLTLLLASCAQKVPDAVETPSASVPAEPSVQPSEAQPSVSVQTAAEVFLHEEPSASEVGRYLTENASSLTSFEGDLLLERLILLQQDVAYMMNVSIWDGAYMSALNDTMGGVLDPSKIDDIEDVEVKSAFSEAVAALMTVVRYEETPVFEMNWKQLESISGAFSPDADDMIVYRSRLQGNTYVGDPMNFDLLAADIAGVEEKLDALDNGFVSWQLRKVFTNQVGNLIVGPEGSFLDEYTDKNSAYNLRLQKYAGMYGGRFGEICQNLYALKNEDSQTVMDYLSGALIFPPDYPLTAEIIVTEENGAWLSVPVLSGEDGALTDKLNGAIRDTGISMIEDGRIDQTVSNYVTVSGDYMSITFACGYLDDESQYHYVETGLVLDLTTGERVTLDDLVGIPFESYKDALLAAMRGYTIPTGLSQSFEISLTDSGMTLSLPSESGGWPDYYSVTFNGLRNFMDISRLY